MGEAVVDIEWRVSDAPVPYPEAVAAMEERVAAIRAGRAPELVWLLEHPPLYTAGTSASERDLVDPGLFPVYRSGRGGQYTYHGPGQRVGASAGRGASASGSPSAAGARARSPPSACACGAG